MAYRDRLRAARAEGALGGVSEADAGVRTRRTRPFVTAVRELWRLLEPAGGHTRVIVALACLTLAVGAGLLVPASTKVAIDFILTDNPGPPGIPREWGLPSSRESLLWLLGGALLAVAAFSALVSILGRWQMTRLAKRVQTMYRRRVFDHAARLPLHRVQALKSGGITSLLRNDAAAPSELLFTLVYNPWRAVIQLVGGLVVLAITDWRMLLGAALFLPAVWFSHRTWIARIRPVYRDIRAGLQGADAQTTEAFAGMRVVRAFARTRGESLRSALNYHLVARQELLAWCWSRVIDLAWSLLIPLASVAVLVYGGRAVLSGALTIGDVMMFSAYVLMLLSPLDVLASTATQIQTQLAGFDRALDLLAEPGEFQSGSDDRARAGIVVTRSTARGHVSISGVSFAYPGSSTPVLDGVTIEARPGETVALVGPSGSGKTTLCNLIARFYDPVAGSITLDGLDLRDLDLDYYRSLLGIVEQDVFLFDGTVAENIAYADRDASSERIRSAARAANADGFVEALELGYDTLIGERGVRLSGGQKQRIAIARALLADPRILILDEATSNLDTESEALIQASLGRLLAGRTCFIIAHRLSTVRNASRIVVLESGRVIESGTHDELLRRRGRYWGMVHAQLHGAGSADGALRLDFDAARRARPG